MPYRDERAGDAALNPDRPNVIIPLKLDSIDASGAESNFLVDVLVLSFEPTLGKAYSTPPSAMVDWPTSLYGSV